MNCGSSGLSVLENSPSLLPYNQGIENTIILTERRKSDTMFIDDEECNDFFYNYRALWYFELDIPKTNRKLIVDKRFLLHHVKTTNRQHNGLTTASPTT